MATKKTSTQKTTATQTRKPASKTVKTTKPKTSVKKKSLSEEKIRETAHKIYEDRISKGIPGDSLSDWAQAEHELKGLF